MVINIISTHNPNCLKFAIDFVWLDIIWECKDELTARKSRLAYNLWGIDGVIYLLFGMEFVLITKDEKYSWDEMSPVILEVIGDYLQNHKKVFESIFEEELKQISKPVLNDIEKKIDLVLKDKIQPALELHGGLVELISFKDGILTLDLQGACKNCPGSEETLKYGIKNLMQYYFPEVLEVVSL